MRDEITVLKVEPGKPPELVSMANTLQAMQEMVGGYIEIVPLDDAAWCATMRGSSMVWKAIDGSAATS